MGRLGIALICLALWHTPQWRRDADRPDVAAIALAEVGVREASGKNDGARVEEYLRYVNLRAGQPWCAAFVCWVYGKAGVENPRSGWCPSLFPLRRVVWQKGLLRPAGPVPCRGDVFGLWFESRGRIAHVGLVDDWGDKYVTTIEGNTNEAGSREGDGVYRKRRLCSSIYKVARWHSARGLRATHLVPETHGAGAHTLRATPLDRGEDTPRPGSCPKNPLYQKGWLAARRGGPAPASRGKL